MLINAQNNLQVHKDSCIVVYNDCGWVNGYQRFGTA
jgi:hypothetical protein